LTQALILGAVLAIFCYHLAMVFIYPTRSLGYYPGYILALMGVVFVHAENPLWHLTGPAEGQPFLKWVEIITGAGVPICYLLTCVAFIHGGGWRPRLRRWLIWLIYLFVVDLGISLLTVAIWGVGAAPWGAWPLRVVSALRVGLFSVAMGLLIYAIACYLRSPRPRVALRQTCQPLRRRSRFRRIISPRPTASWERHHAGAPCCAEPGTQRNDWREEIYPQRILNGERAAIGISRGSR